MNDEARAADGETQVAGGPSALGGPTILDGSTGGTSPGSTTSTPDATASSSRTAFRQLRGIAETLILTVVIFFGIQTFVAQPYVVEQESMKATLLPDESVLVDKLTPRFDDYSRGDIVVFHPPPEEGGGTPFIKRVIGVPGDTVELRDGSVYVDGVRIPEPYIWDELEDPVTTVEETGVDSWTVPADAFFLMGDHRNQSRDSRSFGPIVRGQIIGRAVLRYWPLNKLTILPTPTYPDTQPVTP